MAVDLQGLGTLLAAGGGIGGLLAVLRIAPELRRLQSETRKIEADTDNSEMDSVGKLATTALQQMQAAVDRAEHAELDVTRARAELAAVRDDAERERRAHERYRRDCTARNDRLEQLLRDYRAVAQEHVAWDYQRVSEAQAAGVVLAAPPPLLPPLAGN